METNRNISSSSTIATFTLFSADDDDASSRCENNLFPSMTTVLNASIDTDDAYAVRHHHHKRWSRWPIPNLKLTRMAVMAGCTASFLFGFILSLPTLSEKHLATEVYPCTIPEWNPENWDTNSKIPIEIEEWSQIVISKECYTLLRSKPNENIAHCNKNYKDHERIEMGCNGCVVPTPLSCERYSIYDLIQSCIFMYSCALGALGARFTLDNLKMTNYLTMGIIVTGTALVLGSNSYHMYTISRSLSGIGVGYISVFVPLWIANYSPKDQKGFYGVLHQLCITIGIFFNSALSFGYTSAPIFEIVSYNDGLVGELSTFDKVYWRVVTGGIVLAVVITNIVLFAYVNVESPIVYLNEDRDDHAIESLLRVYRGDLEEVNAQLRHLNRAITRIRVDKEYGVTFFRSWTKQQYRVLFVVVGLISMIQQFSGINIYTTSTPSVLEDLGLSSNELHVIELGQFALNVFMTIPTIYLIDRWGRRDIMIQGALIMLISAVLPVIGRFCDPESYWSQVICVLGGFLFIGAFAYGFGPVLWVWVTEVFPESLKLSGMSFVVFLNWCVSGTMILINYYLEINVAYLVFQAIALLSWLFLIFCFKETRGMPQGVSPYLISHERAYHLDEQYCDRNNINTRGCFRTRSKPPEMTQ